MGERRTIIDERGVVVLYFCNDGRRLVERRTVTSSGFTRDEEFDPPVTLSSLPPAATPGQARQGATGRRDKTRRSDAAHDRRSRLARLMKRKRAALAND
jgi:hypothetical protein